MSDNKPLELETINKLYLELSQIATAKPAREIELEELLRSAHAIAHRKGEDVNWQRFAASCQALGIGPVTARTYRILPSDEIENRKLTKAQAEKWEAEMRRMEADPNVDKHALRLFMQTQMECGHLVGNLLTCPDPPFGCVICGEPDE